MGVRLDAIEEFNKFVVSELSTIEAYEFLMLRISDNSARAQLQACVECHQINLATITAEIEALGGRAISALSCQQPILPSHIGNFSNIVITLERREEAKLNLLEKMTLSINPFLAAAAAKCASTQVLSYCRIQDMASRLN